MCAQASKVAPSTAAGSGAASSSGGATCPFAAAPSPALIAQAKNRCPAFSGGCPFSETKTAEHLKKTLETMPLSHTDPTSATAGMISIVVRQRSDSGDSVWDMGRVDDSLFEEFVGWWSAALQDAGDGAAPSAAGAGAPPAARGLAERLKKGTEDAHAEAENVSFVRLLLAGKAPLESYVCLVAALRRIYAALEAAADACRGSCAAVEAVSDGGRADALRRAPALERDLAYYRAKDPALVARAEAFAAHSPATEAYVAHLARFEAKPPEDQESLVSHLYTRYLGDLSGGQILRRAVVRAYDLAPEEGTTLDASEGVTFYDFAKIGSATKLRRFKDAYRNALDALDVESPNAVVDEAVSAFRRNTALLKELDFVVLGAEAAARNHARAPQPKKADAPPQCPFLAKQGPDLALAYGDHATCPFTGAPAKGTKPALKHHATGGGGGCPLADFGARDVALVALLFLALSAATHLLSR